MGYKVKFAGSNLHEYFTILSIKKDLMPQRTNYKKEVDNYNGSFYKGYKFLDRKITLNCLVHCKNRKEHEFKVQQIADILNVKNPSQLIVEDEDKCFYAIPDGKIDLNKIIYNATFSIEFLCTDPLKYDINYTSIMMNLYNNFRFNDMGTYNSYPILGFEFSKPSSFVYLANENKESLLIGKIKDDTVETIQDKSLLIDDYCTDSSTFTLGGNVTVSDNRVVSGAYGVGNNGNSIVATSYGSDIENKWTGPTFRKNIGKNLKEFEVRVNMSFSSHGQNFDPPNVKDLVRVAKKSGTYMYAESDPNSTIILSIPYGTDLSILEFTPNKMCRVTYNGKTGHIKTDDVWRINRSTTQERESDDIEWGYAEEQMGLIEVLGFDSNSQLLFRFHIRDNNKYFEHVIPEVYIKDKLHLYSNTIIPTPTTINMKDNNGNPTGQSNIASGMFGDWNDYTGTFTIRRKKLENGKYRWWAKITRTEDGINISKEINMGPGVINDSLPTGELNHLVFYISKFSGAEAVSVMTVNHVKVYDISNEDGSQNEEVNIDIFQQGDYLEVDFENCKVTLNGDSCIDKLDIGSSFFSVEKNSLISVRSDDENLKGSCSYRKRYL
ncbi:MULTISPECIES: distal tail protein Dit [Bacillota]|uniref:distal tail protein Dit n=1 Tax=Bacillota TaxID=1239 RepID=UPI00256FDEB0|nr:MULTISPECIES: distal tail protein Dit [Bacillota]